MEVPIIYPDRKRLEVAYRKRLPCLEQEREGLELQLKNLLQTEEIKATVKGRIKAFDSYYAKLLRKLASTPVESLSEQEIDTLIQDLVGVRILTPFLESVTDIERLVRGRFSVFEVERKGEEQSFCEFGYRSIHLNIRLDSGQVCEIQIRTILQDAWAEVEHELVYKGSFSPFDEPLKRKLAALNATLSLSDIIFQEVRDYQRKLNRELRHRRETFERQVKTELSGTSPLTMMENLPSHENIDDLDQSLLHALQVHNSGDYGGAVALYGKILAGPLSKEIRVITLMHRGMARFADADYAGAEEDFLAALSLEGHRGKAHYYLGILYRVTGRPGQALKAFSTALEINPYHFESLLGSARALYDLGDTEEALSCCDNALRLVPDDEAALLLRRTVVRKLGL